MVASKIKAHQMPRIFCNSHLTLIDRFELPVEAARHVQVLRLQPGTPITLFNGQGGEFGAEVLEMTRREVYVRVHDFNPIEREARLAVHMAIGMPANERMDWLIEKCTELGLTQLSPLMTQHNVVKLNAERGDKKILHWNSIAAAACAQCGRNRAPKIDPPITLNHWLKTLPTQLDTNAPRWFFSLDPVAQPLYEHFMQVKSIELKHEAQVVMAFGPEGGWSSQEESTLRAYHFTPVSLGERTLRAETAAIAALASLSLLL